MRLSPRKNDLTPLFKEVRAFKETVFRYRFLESVRSEKLQNKFFEFLSWILPRILLRIFPDFFRGFFVLRFVGNRDQKKFSKNPTFFQCKFPGKYEKNIHKTFLESRQSKESAWPR